MLATLDRRAENIRLEAAIIVELELGDSVKSRIIVIARRASDEAIQSPVHDSGLFPASPRLRRTGRFARK
jgi:hypothetical protein